MIVEGVKVVKYRSVNFKVGTGGVKTMANLFKYLLIITTCVTLSHQTPYYEFVARLEEYKTSALEETNCGLWQEHRP